MTKKKVFLSVAFLWATVYGAFAQGNGVGGDYRSHQYGNLLFRSRDQTHLCDRRGCGVDRWSQSLFEVRAT